MENRSSSFCLNCGQIYDTSFSYVRQQTSFLYYKSIQTKISVTCKENCPNCNLGGSSEKLTLKWHLDWSWKYEEEPSIICLGEETKTLMWKDKCTLFIAALFTITKIWKQS